MRFFRHALAVLFVVGALGLCSSSIRGQTVGGNVGGGNVGGGNVGGNTRGTGTAGGIKIDAQGVVTPGFTNDRTGTLSRKRLESEAEKLLTGDVNTSSPLRKVSLVRLEAACEELAKDKKPVSTEMLYLAGLQRIDYVFVYPETHDLVIAGPAEGFAPNQSGRMIGVESGRPPLRLDDLLIALRALEHNGEIGCSIDPVRENLARFRQYLAQNSTPATPGMIAVRFKQMAEVLGLQNVRVFGVPTDSHYAEVLVEADYRMKRIALDLEKPGVKGLRSHLSMATQDGNTMQRWWFVPLYDAFYRSEDGDAYKLEGQRAQLLAQEELVLANGQRVDAATTKLSTQTFARLFTEKFPELADVSPVFAELQNLIDLAVVAALFKKERLPERVGWTMPLFLDPERATYGKGNPPRKVMTVVNSKNAGQTIVGLVAGGVTMDPMKTLRQTGFREDSAQRLEGHHKDAANPRPPEAHPWWWD